MVQILYSDRFSKRKMLSYFIKDLGGCNNKIIEDNGLKMMEGFDYDIDCRQIEKINGGALDGFHGFIGHCAEKHLSWAIAIGGACLYVETIPESYETMLLLSLT